MKKNILHALCIFALVGPALGQATLTPEQSLGLQSETITIPAKFTGAFPAGKTVNIPPGYKARVFYAGGLTKPRFMAFSPSGVLHVADMGSGGQGKIYALPDENHDGIADTAIVVSQGYTTNHDVKFYNGHMYVTETTKVWECTDANDDGIYESKTEFITGIPGGGNHVTRTIVFDSANHKLYLSIGSSCNVCRESDRAIIEQYNDDGTGKVTYATGTRNAVGMAMHPVTNRLWANNNGSDNQGNEVPPEWIDLVRPSGFYGHPLAYGNQVWFDFDLNSEYSALKPITQTDTNRVTSMIMPAALIRSHSAPLGMQFLNASFPAAYNKGFITALHGSWNTTQPNAFRGYKVIYSHLSSDEDTTVDYIAEFCTGFITDTVNRVYWGRPAGVAADDMGNLYISSDETNTFILQLYRDNATGINHIQEQQHTIGAAYPNPSNSTFTVPFTLCGKAHVRISIYDRKGRMVRCFVDADMNAGSYMEEIDWNDISEGLYLLNINAGEINTTQKIYKSK